MSNEKLASGDLIERDTVLQLLSELRAECGWRSPWLEKRIAAIPAATVSGTKPSIDWSHVAPGFNWLARDENGEATLFCRRPATEGRQWCMIADDDECFCARPFASYTPGTCDWRDSLIMRPGYKGE